MNPIEKRGMSVYIGIAIAVTVMGNQSICALKNLLCTVLYYTNIANVLYLTYYDLQRFKNIFKLFYKDLKIFLIRKTQLCKSVTRNT